MVETRRWGPLGRGRSLGPVFVGSFLSLTSLVSDAWLPKVTAPSAVMVFFISPHPKEPKKERGGEGSKRRRKLHLDRRQSVTGLDHLLWLWWQIDRIRCKIEFVLDPSLWWWWWTWARELTVLWGWFEGNYSMDGEKGMSLKVKEVKVAGCDMLSGERGSVNYWGF